MKDVKILFMGTASFSRHVLEELLKKYEDIDAEKKSKRTSKKRCNSHKSETLIQNNVTEKQSDKLKSETIENDLKYFNR